MTYGTVRYGRGGFGETMTVHMVRFRCSPDADAFLIDSYLPQWLTTHTAWAEAENEPPTLTDPESGGQYYAADWRFEWSADKSVLMSNLTQYTAAYAPWHRIGYHVCDHDAPAEARSGCSWDDEYTAGEVPDGVSL